FSLRVERPRTSILHRLCSNRATGHYTKVRTALDRAVKAVAEITESRNDVLVIVETAIDDGRVDRDGWIMLLDGANAFRGGDDEHDADTRRSGFAQELDAGDRTAAGGQHRIDHQHETRMQAARQLGIVARRYSGYLIALQADMSDTRIRHEFEHGIEHPE